MIKSLAAGPVTIQHDRVARYLVALSSLCLEIARQPHLLPLFVQVIRLVPSTLAELQWAQRRLAA
jgi:hypothetical protein